MPIHVVGIGLDPYNLPEHSLEVIEHAQVLYGSAEVLESFEDHPADKIAVDASIDTILEQVAGDRSGERMVVVLMAGDPLYFGGGDFAELFNAEEVVIHPGISSLQTAAARLKISWQDMASVSLHESDDYGRLFSALLTHKRTAVFTDRKIIPSNVAQAVLDQGGGSEDFNVWVMENLEQENERIRGFTLEEAASTTFAAVNMMVVEHTGRPRLQLGLGTPDHEFAADDSLIHGPIRAVCLAALRLQSDSLLWDLNAGCGALGIEASSVTVNGRVYSVEKSGDRIALIRENRAAAGAFLVELVHGSMPRSLADLPDPDRVFLCCDTDRKGEVLAEACHRLKPGGRIVLLQPLFDSTYRAKQVFASMDWPFFVTQVGAAETKESGGDVLLEGGNPVFVIGADKPL
jgi:precorrin-6Y C5,15-methyltransferase (decarboxylating)